MFCTTRAKYSTKIHDQSRSISFEFTHRVDKLDGEAFSQKTSQELILKYKVIFSSEIHKNAQQRIKLMQHGANS